MQKKHSIIRILGITTLIVLFFLFASSAIAETKPDKEKVFDNWATLDMNSLLRSYNIIAFGDVTLYNHQNGGVLIKGDLNGTQSYADGAVTLPSYVQGYVNCSAPYHSAGAGTVIPPLYVGTSNKITHPPYNKNLYILNDKTDYGIATPIYQDTKTRVFLDFDEVRTLLNAASEGYRSGASDISISDKDKQEAQEGRKVTINIDAGAKISIDASLVNKDSPVIDCINIMYSGGIKSETIINIIQSNSNNPIPVSLPDQKINGEQLSNIQNSVHLGTNIIFNLPNTNEIVLAKSNAPHIGHVIAPDAVVVIGNTNYNGTVICKDFTCRAEGHLYPKGGSPIPQYPTLTIPVTKTTANAPANSDAQFSFTITGKNNAPMPENSTITIGPNGTASFDPIKYTFIGRYEYEITEKQTDLPSGYTADDTKYTLVVDVDYNSTQTDFDFDVTVTNSKNSTVKDTLENSIVFSNTYTGDEPPQEQPQGKIHLTKVSASDHSWKLSGAEYSVYEDEDCTEFVGLLTTGSSGTATLENLDTSKVYYVKETKAPADHWVDATVYTVSFANSSTEVSVNGGFVTNIYAPGKILIEKKVESENSADLNNEFRFSISLKTPQAAESYINGITCARIETNGTRTPIRVDGITNKGGDFFIDLKHGEKFVISSLPQGTTYTISEKPCEGFETSIFINGTVVTNCSGTIPTVKNPTYCLFTNKSTATNPDDPDEKEELTPEQQDILNSMPQTGDNQTLFMWLVMLTCSLFGLLSLLRRRSN